MIFEETGIGGAWLIRQRRFGDERGYFARTMCVNAFAEHGMDVAFVQQNTSYNADKGTFRGFHWQEAPHAEGKLVRCTRGSVFDLVLDVRPDSPTFRQWRGFELTADNGDLLYVPPGCGHGYLTLEDNTEVGYSVTEFYAPHAERGVRHDDPAFGVTLPIGVTTLSEKDKNWPDYC